MKKFKQCEWSYKPVIFSFSVGITWDDAPTDQHAVINTDYKIRCVVLASPPATIDWLKESLIVSTGRILHTPLLQNFKKVFLLYHAPVPFFTSLWQGAIMYPTIIAYLLQLTYLLLYKTVVDFSFFNTFLKTFFFFLSCLCLFFLLHMQWSNSHPSWKSYPSVKEVGSSHCVKLLIHEYLLVFLKKRTSIQMSNS